MQTSEATQVRKEESCKAPAIDESLISDGDENLPFISAVYSLAPAEKTVQIEGRLPTNGQTDKQDSAKLTRPVSDAPFMGQMKFNNVGKLVQTRNYKVADGARPMPIKESPGKFNKSPNKGVLVADGNLLPKISSVSGSANALHVNNSSEGVMNIVIKSEELYGSPPMAPSSLPSNVTTELNNVGPVVSVVPQSIGASSSSHSTHSSQDGATGHFLRSSGTVPQGSAVTTLQPSPQATVCTMASRGTESWSLASSSPRAESRRGSGVVSSNGAVQSAPVSHIRTTSQVGTSEASQGRAMPIKCPQVNTIVVAASSAQTRTSSTPRTSTAVKSPVLISPNYRSSGVTLDATRQLVRLADAHKPTTCAITSLVQLVKNGTSSVTPATPIALNSPLMTTTLKGTGSKPSTPVFVPSTLPQQGVIYKIASPTNVDASPNFTNKPVMIAANSVNASQNSQTKTVVQVFTPEGKVLFVQIPNPNQGTAGAQFVQIPMNMTAVAPSSVRIVKSPTITTRSSVPIAPHPGTPSAAHSGVPSAPHPGIPSASHPGVPSAPHPGTPSAPHPGIPSATHPGVPSAPHPGVPSASHPGIPSASSNVVKLVNQAGTNAQIVPMTTSNIRQAPVGMSRSDGVMISRVTYASPSTIQTPSASVKLPLRCPTFYPPTPDTSTTDSVKSISASVPTTTPPAVSRTSDSTPLVGHGPSPHDAKIQRLKELLRMQEKAVDKLRNKRRVELESARESTIVGRSNADGESELDTKMESNPFVMPLPPKKMKHDASQIKGGGRNESAKKKEEGFLPNGDDSQFVQLVGLEDVVEKLKRKTEKVKDARVSNSGSTEQVG